MILARRFFLRTAVLFFDEEAAAGSFDIVRYVQRPAPVEGATCEEFPTLVLDLRQDEATLLAGMKKDTRYEIRRAEAQDDLGYDFWPPGAADAPVEEFRAFQVRFARQKSLAAVDAKTLRRYADSGTLDLSRIRNRDGTLVWHCYYRGRERSRLLYSSSLFRQERAGLRALIGRANRYQHWKDILRFKGEGLLTYDLGGWSPEGGDPEKQRVNRFKEEFGGVLLRDFNCILPVTRRGRAALALERLLGRLKRP